MEVVVDANGDWAESRLRSAAAMQFLAVVNTTKSAQTNQDSRVNTSQRQQSLVNTAWVNKHSQSQPTQM